MFNLLTWVGQLLIFSVQNGLSLTNPRISARQSSKRPGTFALVEGRQMEQTKSLQQWRNRKIIPKAGLHSRLLLEVGASISISQAESYAVAAPWLWHLQIQDGIVEARPGHEVRLESVSLLCLFDAKIGPRTVIPRQCHTLIVRICPSYFLLFR